MFWIAFAVYMALIVADFKYGCDAQSVSVTSRSPSSDIDPVVNVSCMEYDLPSGHTDLTYQWEHNGIVLSRNDVMVDADSSRFSVGDGGRELFIRNAVRDDTGRYTCRVLYRLNLDSQEIMNVSNSHLLSITTYLPPLNYPKCSISSDTGVTVGSKIIFNCDTGESNTPVTLRIEQPDGTFKFSSVGMVEWTVREEYIMSPFVCTMTSNTFPTALRACSASIAIATTPSATTRHRLTTRMASTAENMLPSDPMSGQSNGMKDASLTASGTTTNSAPVYTSSDPGYTGKSERSCIAITVLTAPIIVSIVSIVAVVFLLFKNYQLKRVIASYEKEKANRTNQEVGETYMELQKTKTASDEEYTDLNLQRNPDGAGQKTVYENVNSGFEQSSAEETEYANVV